jgi:uncharacterized delta-60 repeat protein
MRLQLILRTGVAFAILCLGACGGGSDDVSNGSNVGSNNGGNTPVSGIGSAGGTVTGAGGAQVVVPAGALSQNTNIAVAQSSTGAPGLPAGVTAAGQIFAFTPHGTAFATPAIITGPFDPALGPSGATPVLYKTNAAQTAWELVPSATISGTTMSGQVSGFSYGVVGYTGPLTRDEPTREWAFYLYPGNGQEPALVDQDSQVGGLVDVVVPFGSTSLPTLTLLTNEESIPSDYIANGYVFGTNNGATYGALAEAPDHRIGTAEPIGSSSHYLQSQSFVKRASDARLTFTVTQIHGLLEDYNPPLLTGPRPLSAEAYLKVVAQQEGANPFYVARGQVHVFGSNEHYFFRAPAFAESHILMWIEEDFDFEVETVSINVPSSGVSCPGTRAHVSLREPRTYSIDLSSIDVGDEFTVHSSIITFALNRRGGGSVQDCQASNVAAYLRDPQAIEGTTIEYSGLEPTNRPLSLPQVVSAEPVNCSAGPNPDAGLLQFEASSFVADEYAGASPVVIVTRSGGSTGRVSVNISTSDGTAVAGSDYTALSTTVLFGDGDTGSRVVEVPITPDTLGELDETVNLTLSQPGGCASLGTQTTAVLTIRNDDPISTSGGGRLDDTFGTGGKTSIGVFGGEESAMALQADGKIVMVGGSFLDFVLARFNADGTPDTAFGQSGRVSTDIASGALDERARAVAIQPDGKIVVAGESRQSGPPNRLVVALVRYNVDGSLDTTFGMGGIVRDIALVGRAFALVIQADGKIVISGDQPVGTGTGTEDFLLVRYNPDGSPDATFGTNGVVTADMGVIALARNLVLQPDGKIVASGDPVGATVAATAVARFNADGTLDSTFGTGGKVSVVAGNAFVGQGLALQSDGKLVLVGTFGGGPDARFAVARLNADGSMDASFGTSGLVTTELTGLGDTAHAVALDANGRILVSGETNAVNPNFFLVRYSTDGSVDTTFATSGRVEIDFFGFGDVAENIAIQPDGKVVLGGVVKPTGADGYGLARIVP